MLLLKTRTLITIMLFMSIVSVIFSILVTLILATWILISFMPMSASWLSCTLVHLILKTKTWEAISTIRKFIVFLYLYLYCNSLFWSITSPRSFWFRQLLFNSALSVPKSFPQDYHHLQYHSYAHLEDGIGVWF